MPGPSATIHRFRTGPTGDIALSFHDRYRLDAWGRTVASYYLHQFYYWGEMEFGAHGELALSSGYFTGGTLGSLLVQTAPHPVSWYSDFSTAYGGMLGWMFGTFQLDALGNVFDRLHVYEATQVAPTLTLPSAGDYLLRDGASGGAVYAGPPAVYAPDDTGGVFFYGPLQSTLDVGCGPMAPASASGGYVARLDASWSCVWADVLPVATSLLHDGNGGAVLFTTSAVALDLGCGAIPAAAGGSTLVTRLDAAGACVFSAGFDAPNLGVALDPNGLLIVSGLVGNGDIDLGGGPLAPLGAQDFVLGALDPAGNPLWSKRLGAAGTTWSAPPTIALPAAGNVVLLAHHAGEVDYGGGPVSAAASALVVASFTTAGAHRWSRALPIQGVYEASIDGCGALTVASVDAKFDPGCGKLIPWNGVPGGQPPAVALARFQP